MCLFSPVSPHSSLFDVSNLIGHSFLDLIHLGDLPSITKLLNKCLVTKSSLWTPPYRLRIPSQQLKVSVDSTKSLSPPRIIWIRTLFACMPGDSPIKCINQIIGFVGGFPLYIKQSYY
ncbi:unnamed protein product [Dibothriocephalus latus]|uniref:Uncharacterized protein n=1 Tax=Dibothriocephalus latus TaxID=60516 RepID=A0A3P7P321_DIBLA|nr:unnamed protein product [Dibothriocephalus latus]